MQRAPRDLEETTTMVVTFEPTYGAPFPMEVSDKQKVLEIKSNIEALRGIHISRQTLIFEECPLNDGDVITFPPSSRVQVVISFVLPVSPESMASLFLPDGPDKKLIRLYLRVPILRIWASLEIDPSDSVLGLKRKVEQLTEEIPALGKEIEQLLVVGYPDIKNKLTELRGNRNRGETTLIPWEMIILRIHDGPELGDSQILHDCGLVDQSEVIMSLHGLPDDFTSVGPPLQMVPPVVLQLRVWVKFTMGNEEEYFRLNFKPTYKVGVIWEILKEMKFVLPQYSYYYFSANVMGGRALNREQTFGTYPLKDGDMIHIIPWLTAEGQDMQRRLVLGLHL